MLSRDHPIKVLWFVNSAFPAVDKRLGRPEYKGNGTWMMAAITEMEKCVDLEIAVAWASDQVQKYETFEEGKLKYYLIPKHPLPVRKKNKLNRIWSHSKRIFNLIRHHSYTNELKDCVRAVNDFKPNLVHVWGTEYFYGLICNMIEIPVLIKLQGLLSLIKDDYWGAVKWRERVLMSNELLYYIDIKNRAKDEITILKQNKYFEGRTFWDYSHLREHNTLANYYDVPELMRPLFYETKWSIENIKRHSIYTTAPGSPLKGNACLIKAVSIIRKSFPGIQLRIGGEVPKTGYGRLIREMVTARGLDDCVTFLGPLSESEIANELLNAHVYVLSSYIENSSNSLAEAQLVGVPCVAAYVGGVTSLVRDQETGLFFHKGDSATLAMNIRKIFDDDGVAGKLSQEARRFALSRYAKEKVVDGMLLAYNDMLQRTRR